MGNTVRFHRTYTPAQYERAAELWGRLLDSGRVSLKNDDYGSCLEKVPEEHLLQLIVNDGEQTYDYPAVTVTLVSYSDMGGYGSDIDAANVRALEDTPGVQVSTDSFRDAGEAWTQFGELPGDLDDDVDTGLEWLESLVQSIEALNDYPFIDEDGYYQYESECQEAAWDGHILSDITRDLDDWAGGYHWEDFGVLDDDLREMFYERAENWEFQGASTMVCGNQDEIILDIQETVLAAWRAPYVDPAQIALPLAS
ncbi:MAG: hypothetical protein ABIQ18_21510 [Umezawaea sp.]